MSDNLRRSIGHRAQPELLADQAADQLRRRLQAGEWEVGTKLPGETTLAAELGVGRSTIREALRMLAGQGLLRPRQGAGVFVERVEPETDGWEAVLQRGAIVAVVEARAAIEIEAARWPPCAPPPTTSRRCAVPWKCARPRPARRTVNSSTPTPRCTVRSWSARTTRSCPTVRDVRAPRRHRDGRHDRAARVAGPGRGTERRRTRRASWTRSRRGTSTTPPESRGHISKRWWPTSAGDPAAQSLRGIRSSTSDRTVVGSGTARRCSNSGTSVASNSTSDARPCPRNRKPKTIQPTIATRMKLTPR